MVEFREWPKISRLNRDMTVTEKIDGTNGCIQIYPEPKGGDLDAVATVLADGGWFCVAAQSRSRVINPKMDNHGFAKWVQENASTLVADLGEGVHFGEWAGGGIGKRYPHQPKSFWLFNTKRWSGAAFTTEGLDVVPVLHEGVFDSALINAWVDHLGKNGSHAYPYFKAEGVVVYHKAANFMFKVTVEKDAEWKGKSQ